MLLATIRALDEAKVVTPGTITFVANVGEEESAIYAGPRICFMTA